MLCSQTRCPAALLCLRGAAVEELQLLAHAHRRENLLAGSGKREAGGRNEQTGRRWCADPLPLASRFPPRLPATLG
jgi:hypothetical protein